MSSGKRKNSTAVTPRKSPNKSRTAKSGKSPTLTPKLPRTKRTVEGVEAELAAKAQEVFSLYDRDVDGRIAPQQVIVALRAVGLNPSEKEVLTLLQTCVPQGESSVDFRTFLTMISQVDTSMDTVAELEESFRVWDRLASGHIPVEQLRHIMTNMGEKLSEDDMEDMMSLVELDDRGEVKYRELIKIMLSDVI